MVNMESKFCPILRAAGYINGKEMCCDECALYVEVDDEHDGCAFTVLAKAKAEKVKNALHGQQINTAQICTESE